MRDFSSDTLPLIFSHPSYSTYNQNILSTSTLVSPSISSGGFGPVSAQGYGLGYGISDHFASFNVTSYHQKTQTLIDHICESLDQIHQVLE